MLSCIGQSPLNTLEGTKSYFTIAAEKILEDETKRIQLQGWDFNSEDFYQLSVIGPDRAFLYCLCIPVRRNNHL